MIKLKGIKKIYATEERKVHALKGITLDMRPSEFVCVLGPSGCGKTTLLNIIGGLDRYSSGDLIIDGKSTKNFTDEDWDTYRSRKVGFVFQSYNLISHQTVLENVETALVISGIGKEERRKRAIQALVDVGLSEHLRKTPRQLSGGEMQRVAIARAIVNDPQMILADEPTGALDSENSVKIMELLKKIAKDRLVITVTHNDELAKTYATRTIKMKDGEIVSDSAPYKGEVDKKAEDNKKRSFMPYSLAARLSLKNLMGKKVRTTLTSIASSIAIIGISLVLACSNGLNAFIDKIQKDTMSSIPITVSTSTYDLTPQIEAIFGYVSSTAKGENKKEDKDKVFINHTIKNLMQAEGVTNEITEHFLEYLKGINSNKVTYDAVKNVQKTVYKKLLMPVHANDTRKEVNILEQNSGKWSCLPPSLDTLEEQYELVYGKYPTDKTELLLVVDKNSSISDTVLANYLLDVYAVEESKTYYTYEEILTNPYINEYNLVLNDDYFTQNEDGSFSEDKKVELAKHIHTYYRNTTSEYSVKEELLANEFVKSIYDRVRCYNIDPREEDTTSIKLKIVGIIKLNEDTQYGMFSSPIAYTSALNDYVIEEAFKSKIVTAQLNSANANKSVLDGKAITGKIGLNNVLSKLGYAKLPTEVKFYPRTIKDKDYLLEYLDKYNQENGENSDITYVDNVGAVIEVVRVIVGGISTILLALTAISLIVSSIMIGIITYVSVIERTKEIGILRSVGARKKDVVRLFVTETGIIGFISGVCGIILTVILIVPLNLLMANITGVSGFVFLKWWNYIAFIIGAVCLTIVAGLIPSLIASKKDPVKALRSE